MSSAVIEQRSKTGYQGHVVNILSPSAGVTKIYKLRTKYHGKINLMHISPLQALLAPTLQPTRWQQSVSTARRRRRRRNFRLVGWAVASV